jgi:hypothetical protein
MLIDHDPNEPTKIKGSEPENPMLPDFDRAWVHKKYGTSASWVDMLPLVALSVAIYLFR